MLLAADLSFMPPRLGSRDPRLFTPESYRTRGNKSEKMAVYAPIIHF
jgi:hypothetical protein